jgi:hypothetical protein
LIDSGGRQHVKRWIDVGDGNVEGVILEESQGCELEGGREKDISM